jgi:tRNA dimethylallyltransferase
MDIGTAKPSRATRDRIPHHLIDVVDPSEVFTVQEFQALGRSVLDGLAGDGRAIVCGGSGLHFRSLVDPMTFAPTDDEVRSALEELDSDDQRQRLLLADPSAGEHVDLGNRRRITRALEVLELTGATPTERAGTREAEALRSYEPRIPFVGVGVDPGPVLPDRITERFDRMLDEGLLAEVRGLRTRLGVTASQAVGYKELVSVVDGAEPLQSAREKAISATRALAKRQRTFFRRDPRISWQPWLDDGDDRIRLTLDVIEERTTWTS